MNRRLPSPSVEPRRRAAASANGAKATRSAAVQPVRPKAPANRRNGSCDPAASQWTVVDNWPEAVPVTGDEIDVLETYLGNLLDEILGGAHAPE
jgi:hypothetical protein